MMMSTAVILWIVLSTIGDDDPAAQVAGDRPGPSAVELAVQDLDAVLEPIRREHRLPALVAVVSDDEKIIAAGAVGVRRAGGRRRAGLNDRFLLGSCTKSMTATLCARLVEDGKLRWGTTVREAFPGQVERLSPRLLDATLEQLLCHRSGLPDDRQPDSLRGALRFLKGDLPEQRRAAVLLGLAPEPVGDPGHGTVYSNLGFLVAAAMAEQATGQGWEQLMRALLFEPLEMHTAGFGPPGDAQVIDEPWGHSMRNGSLIALAPGPMADAPAALAPALSVHASILDWARYARLHLAAARGKPTLLTADTFDRLHTDRFEQRYSLGWTVAAPDWANGDVLRHAGSNGRWYAQLTIVPQRNRAVLVAGNRDAPEGVAAAHDALVERYVVRR